MRELQVWNLDEVIFSLFSTFSCHKLPRPEVYEVQYQVHRRQTTMISNTSTTNASTFDQRKLDKLCRNTVNDFQEYIILDLPIRTNMSFYDSKRHKQRPCTKQQCIAVTLSPICQNLAIHLQRVPNVHKKPQSVDNAKYTTI